MRISGRFLSWLLFWALVIIHLFLWYTKQYSYPPEFKISDFSYLEQPDGITCGPTSTAMVLNWYDKSTTIDEVENITRTKWFDWKGQPIGMTSPDYIPVAMNELGVPVDLKRTNLDILKYHTSHNRPPIVLLRSGVRTWHYVVVIGYSEDEIVVADPGYGGQIIISVNDFMGAWNFKTDMRGRSVTKDCSFCDGEGVWIGKDLGPLSTCLFCDGSGKRLDAMGKMLHLMDVYSRTAIIPLKSKEELDK